MRGFWRPEDISGSSRSSSRLGSCPGVASKEVEKTEQLELVVEEAECSQPARPPTRPPEAWPGGRGLCGPETAWGGPGLTSEGLNSLDRPQAGLGYSGRNQAVQAIQAVQAVVQAIQAIQAAVQAIQAVVQAIQAMVQAIQAMVQAIQAMVQAIQAMVQAIQAAVQAIQGCC
ncbi:hypothetical protein L211DRAFT_850542 [Terfezia boudieri ATCC MYA-4762]|uniref:Uncharacterized protein n=1 Tax=Terfezia boudieri ATCC MYA-4762 TaxID=1051890 RepID=A0A3N4LL87_9PEZI|nr:hypothetical protein L211DRAFT_850542 [Terfezia boudieri ATCC MYA-4762]